MNRLEEIKGREQKATPGPWNNSVGGSEYVDNDEGFKVCLTRRSRDADFIAHSREDIPWLLERIEQLEERVEAMRAHICRECNKVCHELRPPASPPCESCHWRGHTSEMEDAT